VTIKLLILAALAVFLGLRAGIIPSHHDVCRVVYQGGPKNCSSYDIVSYLVLESWGFIDSHNWLIMVIATIAIARFTFTLKRSTDRLWSETKRLAEGAEEQHGTLKASVEQARRAADAAKKGADAAKVAADISREALTTTDRAWLKVSAELVSPLVFDADTVRVKINAKCVNIGRSPATNVIWNFGMYSMFSEIGRKIDEYTRRRYVSVIDYGHVVFPSEEYPSEWDLSMDRLEFVAKCHDWAAESADGSEALPPLLWPCIFVGVHYALPGDGGRRFTYARYYIDKRGDPPLGFDGAEAEFPLDEIQLLPDPMAGPIT